MVVNGARVLDYVVRRDLLIQSEDIIFASRLNQSVDLLFVSVNVEFKKNNGLHLEYWTICFTCASSTLGISKILITGGNSMVQKEAAHNNMVRNVKPYPENNRSMLC